MSADTKRLRNFTAKFWKRVDVQGPDECWLWTKSATRQGYARTNLGVKHQILLGFPSASTYAYRIAYKLHYGHIDHSLTCDHLCHNRRCCNPRHLRQCAQSDNAKRKWFHVYNTNPVTGAGRLSSGGRKRHPKFDDVQNLLRLGVTVAQASRDLGVSLGSAYAIKARIKRESKST